MTCFSSKTPLRRPGSHNRPGQQTYPRSKLQRVYIICKTVTPWLHSGPTVPSAACRRGLVFPTSKHLGVSEAPKRSTLAYANQNRGWELYQTVFGQLLEKCQSTVAESGWKKKFRFKNKLTSLDSSTIDLCLSLFDWAKFRRTKGAVKLHLLLDHDGYLPSYAVITDGKKSDIKVARTMKFAAGTVLVMDRGYNDYDWFAELTDQGVFFVTRMKANADYGVLQKRNVPEKGNVQRDEDIFFYSMAAAGKEYFFRRVEVWDEEKQDTIVFLTNHLEFGPTTIAAI